MAYTLVVKSLLLAVLILIPFLTNSYFAYQLGLYLLYGMVGQGIALCWGKGGFLPLGQALFFGIGAYISGTILQDSVGWLSVISALILSILIPAFIAGLVGLLVFDRQIGSGPYFSLITLALSLLGYQLANSQVWITGGFNGLTGIGGLPGIDSYGSLYFFIVGALAISTFVLVYLIRTPFGQLLEAVRENEERTQFLGINTSLVKAAAFAISGAIAGLAGAFFAPHQGIVTPQVVGFILSAELVIWAAVGGRFGFIGPIVGAVLIGFLASGLRDSFAYWEVGVALVFILVVLRMPGGISGMITSLLRRFNIDILSNNVSSRSQIIPKKNNLRKPVLKFDNVSVKVGNVSILDNLSFIIENPGVHCLIGPNGAGKTSALNALTGKLDYKTGNVYWSGKSLKGIRPFRTPKIGIGRKLQVPSIFSNLTVRQNIDIAIWVNRLNIKHLFSVRPYSWGTNLLKDLEESFPFLNKTDVHAGTLSVGQRQMLDFAMTVLAEPDLILLDEPCAGLSKYETEKMILAIAKLAKTSKATFIIVEHDMHVVELLSDNVFVMHQGKLLAQGSLEEIRANKEVQVVYAGGSK